VGKGPFRNRPQSIAPLHLVAGFRHRGKFPDTVIRQGVKVHSPLKKIPRFFGKFGQGILKAVKDLPQKARTYFYGEKVSGIFNLVSDGYTPGYLKYLKLTHLTPYTDNFTL
jgi:hypothetical protein